MEMRDFALNIKSKAPDATDQEIVQLWAAAQQNPKVVDEFIGQKALQRVTTAGKKMNPSESPMDASTRIPAPADLPMQLPSPWAGTTQEKANPVNPAAYTISQFDPRLQREADARFAEMYKNQTGDRLLSGLFAAGAGGLEGVKKSEDMWAEKNKKLFDMMVLSEERARKAATEGLAGATSVQNMAQQAGTFQKDMAGAQLDQEAKRLGLIGTALTAEQQQRLNDPNSLETQMAKMMLLDQMRATGTMNPEVRDILNSGKVTAAQMMPFMDPKLLDAFQKRLTTTKIDQETKKIIEDAKKTAAETTTINLGNTLFGNITKGGTVLPTGGVPSLGAGPLQMSFPGRQVEETKEGERRVGLADRASNWQNFGKPGVDRVRQLINTGYSGKGAVALASLLGADQQVELVTELAKMNAMYPDMFPPALSESLKRAQSEPGYSGRALGSMSQSVLNSLLNKYEADMARQFKSGSERNKAVESGERSTDVPLKTVPQETAKSRPPVIRSQAEYDALPVGAKYLDAAGNSHTKRSK